MTPQRFSRLRRPMAVLSLLATQAAAGCTHKVQPPDFREPQSVLEAANLAQSRHWTVRLITMTRDTLMGDIRAEGGSLRMAARELTPGQVLKLDRRVGSNHVSARVTAVMLAASAVAILIGASVKSFGASSFGGQPAFVWGAAGVSAGLVLGVFSQYGAEESRWEPLWIQ